MIPDFSIIVALDRQHVDELAFSFPTWKKNRPALLERPLLLIVDPADNEYILNRALEICGSGFSVASVGDRTFASQREKMLASLVFDGPANTTTPYFWKIDCDTICQPAQPNWNLEEGWLDPEWFENAPVFIAPRWHYSKPASMVRDFDLWADRHPEHFGALRIKHRIVGGVAKHPRMISYCMFGRTDWARKMARLAGDRLPVPSQDTFYSCAATRSGAYWRSVQFNELGWRHIGGGGKRLELAAREAMQ